MYDEVQMMRLLPEVFGPWHPGLWLAVHQAADGVDAP